MHRLNLGARALVSVVLCATVFLSACSTAWVPQALAIIAALTPAITNIVPLIALADKNVSLADIQLITDASNKAADAVREVGKLIDEYNAATADQQPAVLGKILAALAVAQSNLGDILPQLHITNERSAAGVKAAIAAAIAEIGSLAALLPLVQGHKAEAAKLAKVVSAKEFRNRYNSAISAVPGSSNLKLK